LATSGDISDFVYLRPPATSLIIAGINALGFGIVEIAFIVRGQNVILDFLSLLLLVGVLGFMRISSPFKLMLCAFLASQPYTISYVMLPSPDMLLMLVFTSVTYLLVRRVVATKSPQPSYDHLAIGLLLGGGILIRTEIPALRRFYMCRDCLSFFAFRSDKVCF